MPATFSKKDASSLFNAIAPTYDVVNRLMTFGLDKQWREKLFRFLPKQIDMLLDGATGTGDQILFLLEKGLQATTIVGIDLADKMLDIGRKKLKKFGSQVSLQKASLLEIPYPSQTFDAITISFGVRNVVDLPLCLQELFRVLKPGGVCLILECSVPENPLVAFAHKLYMKNIMPKIGWLLSKNIQAYRYLNQTSQEFPSGETFLKCLERAGFQGMSCYPLSLGSVSLYVAKKYAEEDL